MGERPQADEFSEEIAVPLASQPGFFARGVDLWVRPDNRPAGHFSALAG